jgi:Flp pilus assembly protein TadB
MALAESATENTAQPRVRRADRHRHQVRRGLLTLAVGLLAFPAGMGLALPYLAKTGLSPATVVGLALLVLGALLLASGVAALVRARAGWCATW